MSGALQRDARAWANLTISMKPTPLTKKVSSYGLQIMAPAGYMDESLPLELELELRKSCEIYHSFERRRENLLNGNHQCGGLPLAELWIKTLW